MKATLLAAMFAILPLPKLHAAGKPHAPDLSTITQASSWRVTHAKAEREDVDGKRAVRLVADGDSAAGHVGLAVPEGIVFATGTIEIDLKGKNVRQRSFLGVAFNVVDERTFEAVYFRPFNFSAEAPRNRRSVQYIAWPEHTWEHLRTTTPGVYEHVVDPVPDPDGWFHARIEVDATSVRVFVNEAKAPSLVVKRLSAGETARPIGLFVDTSDGHYANLAVTAAD